MANTAAKKITYDGKPVQVESAIRDGSGKVISSTYAPKFTVTDSNPTLAWGTKSKVATVAGTAINVTMPANPTTGLVTGVSSVNTKTGAVTLSASDVGALPSSTKYAGSSSAGGAATTALACTGNSATATLATKAKGLIYIVGTGTVAGTWLGSSDDITAYYDGLSIAYYINVAGASTTTLNINNLGAKTVRRNTGNLTTHLPVGTVVILTYATISNTGYWIWADYDSDGDTKARQTLQTGNYNLPLLMSYVQTSDTTTNRDGVTYRNNSIYANTSTGVITAPGFAGDLTGNVVGSLTGNASTATAVSVSAPSAPAAGSSRTTYLALLPSTASTQTPERSFAQVTVTRPNENQLWYTVSNMTAANANAVPWTGVTGKPDLYTAPEAVNTNMDSLGSGFTFRTSTAILGKTSNWFVETFVNGGYKMQRATDLADPSNVCIRTKNGSSASWSTWTYSYAVWKV